MIIIPYFNFIFVFDIRSSEKFEGSVGSKSSLPKMNFYQYPKPYTNSVLLSSLELRVELIFILNKFLTVKKLTFSLDSIDKRRKDEILLILLNHEWLFPNVFEVDFNLNDEELETALGYIFKGRLDEVTKRKQRTTTYDSAIKKQPTWKAKYEDDDDGITIEDSLLIKDYNRMQIKKTFISYKNMLY